MRARRSRIGLVYQGTDITADISGEVVSVSYTDALDEADMAEISLKDETRKWLLHWKPTRADGFSLSIHTDDWKDDGDTGVLDCGTFLVDKVSYSGKPTTVTIGGVSMPRDETFADAKNSRTWERVTLSEIASSLLPAGYALDFRSTDDPPIEYAEQKEQENCSFLYEVAHKYGFRVKLFRRSVILINAAEMEAQPPARTFTESDFYSWSLEANLTRTLYDGCTVKYKHPKTEEELEYTFIVPGASGGKLWETTQAVSSIADAERVAKAELRKKNQDETGLSFTLMGDTGLFAGQVVALTGFGDFDGRYAVDTVKHSLTNGYRADVSMHRCLEGY